MGIIHPEEELNGSDPTSIPIPISIRETEEGKDDPVIHAVISAAVVSTAVPSEEVLRVVAGHALLRLLSVTQIEHLVENAHNAKKLCSTLRAFHTKLSTEVRSHPALYYTLLKWGDKEFCLWRLMEDAYEGGCLDDNVILMVLDAVLHGANLWGDTQNEGCDSTVRCDRLVSVVSALRFIEGIPAAFGVSVLREYYVRVYECLEVGGERRFLEKEVERSMVRMGVAVEGRGGGKGCGEEELNGVCPFPCDALFTPRGGGASAVPLVQLTPPHGAGYVYQALMCHVAFGGTLEVES